MFRFQIGNRSDQDMSRPAFFGEFPNPLIGVIRSLGAPEIQRFQRRFDSLPVHKRKSLRIFPQITGHIFRADYNGTLF